jgi:hypothetical protein
MSETNTNRYAKKAWRNVYRLDIKKAFSSYSICVFNSAFSLLLIFVSRYLFKSEELVMYSASFGVIFFVLFNPWLQLLTEENSHYFWYSLLYYFIIAISCMDLYIYGLISQLSILWRSGLRSSPLLFIFNSIRYYVFYQVFVCR